MKRNPPLLDRISVKQPCTEDWNSMVGNDQVRFCSHCNFDVHNLSGLTREQAEELARRSKGRLCVRYVQTPDKKVLTLPPPVPLVRLSRRVSQLAAGAFSVALSLSTVAAQIPDQSGAAATTAGAMNPQRTAGGLGSVSGTVMDQTGAVLAGAKVRLYGVGGLIQEVESGENGTYLFRNIGSSVVSIEFEVAGFRTTRMENIEVESGQHKTAPDAKLEVGCRDEITGIVAISSPIEQFVTHWSERGESGEVDEKITEFLETASSGEIADLKKLLVTGYGPDMANEYGETALMLNANNKKVVKTLLQAGADPNARTRFGVTPLMYSLLNFNKTVMKWLIASGADVNAQETTGKTPLMLAVLSGNNDAVGMLLAARAQVHIKDTDGKTALAFALETENEDIAKLLKAAGAR